MCQTLLLSQNMVRMSKRTYSHRLEVATPNCYNVGRLARLNKDLDSLYELVYGQWRTITDEDYRIFGGQYKILLQTIKDLYNACRKAPGTMGLKEETRKLGMNYSALYELNADIVTFGIHGKDNTGLVEALHTAGELLKNIDK